MLRKIVLLIVVCCSSVFGAGQLPEGNRCKLKSGVRGRCTFIKSCPNTTQDIQQGIFPKICSYNGIEPIICCPTPPGAKAQFYCEKFYNMTTILPGKAHTFVVGGELAKKENYEHMVALGFGNESNKEWLCGGTLISEDFVITAAHCLGSTELGPVRWARIGVLNLKENVVNPNAVDYSITNMFRHPDYKQPSSYNDIALLQLNRKVEIGPTRKPACLNTEFKISNDVKISSAGWGLTAYAGEKSYDLLTVDLNIHDNQICRKKYANTPKRKLSMGILEESQICAGGAQGDSKDTCQGDSGGPLQMKHPKLNKLYILIGITSFGIGCGVADIPGVYTRVSYYIPWIESVVWKDEVNSSTSERLLF